MEIRLLGPVDLLTADGVVPLGSPKQRAALAAVAIDAGRVVQVETLGRRIWGLCPPERARRTLRTYIARTRRLLQQVWSVSDAPVGLMFGGGGYTLRIDPACIDLHRFRQLVGRATGDGLPASQRIALIDEAMSNTPLAGVSGEWADQIRDGLCQEYVGSNEHR